MLGSPDLPVEVISRCTPWRLGSVYGRSYMYVLFGPPALILTLSLTLQTRPTIALGEQRDQSLKSSP